MDRSTSYLWQDRKRIIFGLPWSFTKYKLTEKKLIIETGLLNTTQDEIMLYRIMDMTLKRTLGERLFGLGTIHCCSADKTSPEFNIKRIKHSQQVMDMLSDLVDEARKKYRVTMREGHYDFDDLDDLHDDAE